MGTRESRSRAKDRAARANRTGRRARRWRNAPDAQRAWCTEIKRVTPAEELACRVMCSACREKWSKSNVPLPHGQRIQRVGIGAGYPVIQVAAE